MKTSPLLLVLVLLAACADRKSEIEKAMRQYDHLTLRMNADSLADSYLPNGVLNGKGMKRYVGRDSIRTFLKSFNSADIHLISNSTKTQSITFKGDTAIVIGDYEQKAKLVLGNTGVYTGTFTAKWLLENNRWLLASMYTMPVKPIASLKSVLLQQLKTTHSQKEWFVPTNIALEGLTAKQAMWKDGSGNHSVGQLAFHLMYWNERLLKQFNNEPLEKFSGNNEETFNSFNEEEWNEIVKKLDDVLLAWEQAIKKADEAKLSEWQENIANMSTHNAYHTGQIIFLRKLQGSWDPEKGVK
ncbi:MAG: DinB family protein [Bacteroidetes bacterium]|nr:DinB family protein [Bacteroidota bacterium]